MKLKRFLINLSYTITSQSISLLMSIIINLILPKVLGIKDFSYWQLFIFYSQYIPFLHLGLNDGVYLRYGGTEFENLNKGVIKAQLFLGLIYQSLFCIVLCFFSWLIILDEHRLIIIILSIIYFMFYTVQNYLGYIFQATNRFDWFSKAIILDRIFFIIMMLISLFMNEKFYLIYIIIYILGQLLSLIYSLIKGKDIILSKIVNFRENVEELILSLKAGSKLMLANIASMLILGSGRQVIDMTWGVLTFGKISFAITLGNFFLIFIRQVGLVMFPTLRQLNKNEQRYIYELSRKGIFLFLPVVYILYFPLKFILSIWLPEYIESLNYLSLILPICFFDAKMQILFNTYLKVKRKENTLFKINALALLISVLLTFIGVFIFDSVVFVVFGMVLSVMFRSILAEIILSKSLYIKTYNEILQEIVLAYIFMIIAWFMDNINGFAAILIIYLLFILINKKRLKELLNKLRRSK